MMKAVICEKFGPPEVLTLAQVEKPTPQPNEVLIKINFTTATVADARIRGFRVPPSYWIPARLVLGLRKPKNPIFGMELAGTIEAVGQNVTRFKPGDAVFASTIEHGYGAYAQYKCMPKDGLIALIPPHVRGEEAVVLPIGGRTALYFLRAAHIQPGQSVLINGASGSVGSFAVQLAKLFGAEVTGVCSGKNLALVESLGADHLIDYTQSDFTQQGQQYDVIFDTVGKAPYSASLKSLKPDGYFLQAVSAPAMSLRMMWTSRISNQKTVGGGPPKNAEDLVFLAELVETGKLKPLIDRCYPLEDIAQAHHYVDSERKRGNVVITLAPQDKG